PRAAKAWRLSISSAASGRRTYSRSRECSSRSPRTRASPSRQASKAPTASSSPSTAAEVSSHARRASPIARAAGVLSTSERRSRGPAERSRRLERERRQPGQAIEVAVRVGQGEERDLGPGEPALAVLLLGNGLLEGAPAQVVLAALEHGDARERVDARAREG